MKLEKLFRLAMAVLFLATAVGCIDNDDDDDNESDNQTHPPIIESVWLEIDDPGHDYLDEYPWEADVGMSIIPVVTFFDRDTDLHTLHGEFYHESDDYSSPVATYQALIPHTTLVRFGHWFDDDSFLATAPTGHWKLRFYAVDVAGNESNDFEVDLFVR